MKKFFSSLLLGFGSTFAVLIVLAMPPGGWGVAVGVALGLLAAVPLFLVLMTLIKHQSVNQAIYQEHSLSYREPAAVPPMVIIQQRLPQGQSMPLPPNAYQYYPEQYDEYEQYYDQAQYIDPRLLQKQARVRVKQRIPEQLRQPKRARPAEQAYYDDYENQNNDPDYSNYYSYGYEVPNPELYEAYQDFYTDAPNQPQQENYYNYNQPSGQHIAPPDLKFYEEQQLRRRRDIRNYKVRQAGRPNTPANNYNRKNNDPSEIVEAQYREINVFGEDF